MQILRSPLFIVCLVSFIIHQVMQKIAHIHNVWIDAYADNLLAMPVILTLLQAERIVLFKRGKAYKLSVLEIALGTAYISLLAELVFPLFSKNFKGDWIDVLCYTVGSVVFYFVNKASKIDRLNERSPYS